MGLGITLMARKIHIEYAGAAYHVMARGNQGRDIYGDDPDRKLWLATLGEACEKTGWRIHAWVVMNNHYHLLLETPEANLVAGMKWLQGTYTQRYNSRHEQVSVPTIDTFGCARFHPFGNGKPQKRVGPATRERRKPWRRQAPNRRLVSLVVGPWHCGHAAHDANGVSGGHLPRHGPWRPPGVRQPAGREGVLGRNYEGGLVLAAFVQGGQLHPVLLSQAGEIEVCGVFAR